MSNGQKMQSLTDEFQALQKDLSSVVEARQRLESQLQENKAVQKEFSTLDSDAKIYKSTGPVLLKQDKSEAIMNVNKRIEFIESEINRTEAQIKSIQEKQERKKMEIMQLQSAMQQEAGPA